MQNCIDPCTCLHLLNEVGEHDNGVCIAVPHKPPEVSHCVRQWALGSYVLVAVIVALESVSTGKCTMIITTLCSYKHQYSRIVQYHLTVSTTME